MNYEKEYIRLWNAAEQAMENVDFDKRFINSWAALRILKNAVNWGRDKPDACSCEMHDRVYYGCRCQDEDTKLIDALEDQIKRIEQTIYPDGDYKTMSSIVRGFKAKVNELLKEKPDREADDLPTEKIKCAD